MHLLPGLIMTWIIAIILGLIEGITEFIPVSSTGHLKLAEHLLGVGEHDFLSSDVFNAVIQVGAVLAALPLFSSRLATLREWQEPANREYFLKLGLAFGITVVGALTFKFVEKHYHIGLPHTVGPIGWALLVGGVLFIVVERWLVGREAIMDVSWTLAVVFGLAQVVAVAFPGTSRSGATILFALMFGLGRGPATEFSFLLGVPTLCAAGAKTLLDALKHKEDIMAHGGVIHWGPLILASLVAAVSSILAVRWMLSYVRSHTFTGFGWYRVALGLVILGLHYGKLID